MRFDWTALYLAGRQLGVSPSEFWDMTLPELFAEIGAQEPKGKGPGLSNEDRDKFSRWLNGEDVE